MVVLVWKRVELESTWLPTVGHTIKRATPVGKSTSEPPHMHNLCRVRAAESHSIVYFQTTIATSEHHNALTLPPPHKCVLWSYIDQAHLLLRMSVSRTPSPSRDSGAIDRQTTTPFLLNFCYRSSAFHNLADFPIPSPSNPKPSLPAHLQIYTWYSCTLKELAHLLTTALPNIMPDPVIGTRLSFRLVYPDTSPSAAKTGRLGGEEGRGRYVSKEMGSVVVSASEYTTNGSSGRKEEATKASYELGGDDAEKTLGDLRFVIGDFIDCAVFPPLSDGTVVPRSSVGGPVRSGYRENGYGRPRGGGGFGMSRGGFGGARGDFGGNMPSGEWRRGERLPEGGFRGGSYGGRGGRRAPY